MYNCIMLKHIKEDKCSVPNKCRVTSVYDDMTVIYLFKWLYLHDVKLYIIFDAGTFRVKMAAAKKF